MLSGQEEIQRGPVQPTRPVRKSTEVRPSFIFPALPAPFPEPPPLTSLSAGFPAFGFPTCGFPLFWALWLAVRAVRGCAGPGLRMGPARPWEPLCGPAEGFRRALPRTGERALSKRATGRYAGKRAAHHKGLTRGRDPPQEAKSGGTSTFQRDLGGPEVPRDYGTIKVTSKGLRARQARYRPIKGL